MTEQKDFTDYVPPTWDETFMKHVYLTAEKSKDPRTKIGAVVVKDKHIISSGFNGFPRKVKDLPERYNVKEIKYKFVAHAEDNSILTAAKLGISTDGGTLYTQGIPCCECTKSVINGGIIEIVVHKQWPNLFTSPIWTESIKISKIMLEEAGIPIRWLDVELGMKGFLDGKILWV